MDQETHTEILTSEQTKFSREIGVFGGVSIIGGIMDVPTGIFGKQAGAKLDKQIIQSSTEKERKLAVEQLMPNLLRRGITSLAAMEGENIKNNFDTDVASEFLYEHKKDYPVSMTRIWLTRSFRPFQFTSAFDHALAYQNTEKLGLYIHIPFCRSLCTFCPYCKVVYQETLAGEYVRALKREIAMVGSRSAVRKKVTSLYFGGGTPALLANEIAGILETVNRYFEITESVGLELHPADVTEQNLRLLKDAGVTRISIGIQSFSDNYLEILGRGTLHWAPMFSALNAVPFETVSMDFIFALPGQTLESVKQDIDTAFSNGANHAAGPYNYQNFEIDGWAYYTNNPPAGAFRGFGVTQTCFCIESLLNQMADKVGITPWEIRYRNAIRPGQELPNGQIVDESTGLVETLEAVKPYYDAAKYVGIGCAMDHPNLEAKFVENAEPTSPYGTKALGEPPACSGAPAIRNAILQATGVEIGQCPVTPHILFEKFEEAGLIQD